MVSPLLLQPFILFLLLKISSSAEQTNFVYNGFRGAHLNLSGSALVHPNGLLQLTNSSNHQIGRMFYPSPLKFRNASCAASYSFRNASCGASYSFSTSFVSAIIPGISNLSGNGVAFVISPSKEFPGALPDQYMGLFNDSTNNMSNNRIFFVELDTVLNPEFVGINNNHLGVGVNGLRTIASATATATYYDNRDGKNKSLSLVGGKPVQVWIDYDGVKNQIKVTASPWKIPKPNIPLFSSSLDLSQIFLENMYVGFTSSTGTITGSHYLLGWSFKMNGQSQPINLCLLPPVPPQTTSNGNGSWKIWLSLVVSALVLVTIFGILYMVKKRNYIELREDWEQEYGPQRFSYKDLSIATKGFIDKELLGIGGFGKVYKGVLRASGAQVAVKVRQVSDKVNIDAIKEFVAEIVSMGRLRHRNLVQLLGYCRCKGHLMLVYDFMPNGSLDKFLFCNDRAVLSWNQRYKILQGVASGLVYLHEEWDQVVLHRDIKASNVLLDADFNGRLGDFGLARLYDHGTNPPTTRVVGTLGYLAPEFIQAGHATTSTDVFSFGAFLLEVACGRPPISLGAPAEEMVLVDWVFENWKNGSIQEARDSRLGDKYVVEELELALKLGLVCSYPIPEARPSMRQVMQYLDGDAIFHDSVLEGFSLSMASAVTHGGFADFIKLYSASPETDQDHELSGEKPLLPRSCCRVDI